MNQDSHVGPSQAHSFFSPKDTEREGLVAQQARLSLGMPASPGLCWSTWFKSWLLCTPDPASCCCAWQWIVAEVLGFLPFMWKTRGNSWLPAEAWPRPVCCVHLGNESVAGGSSPSPHHSDFQINEIRKDSDTLCGTKSLCSLENQE